ncbi:MAG: Anaerobic ribonucleoside-triphosphate reductase-activating protein [Syntrophomonadaceae bacterium]|nr:Anaerobic ribonucleoside-triphosphate reductase-activating protein [Bacillota bacterium]
MKLKLAGLKHYSVVDGPGIRTAVFLQGCPHLCPGCHNPQTQDFAGGRWLDVTKLAAEIGADRGVRGVTFSGGEPFAQAEPLVMLAEILKKADYQLMIYSGYTYEQLKEKAVTDKATAALLAAGDLLVDGPFLLAERDISLTYRGSRNQRIIDLPATIQTGSPVLSPLHFRGQAKIYG